MADIVAQVGDGGKKHRGPRWQTVLIVVAVLVLALGAGAGARWFQQYEHRRSAKQETVIKAASNAQEQSFHGDYTKAHETVSNALENPNLSTAAKQQLYMQDGVTYESQQNYDAAMASYRKAEALGLTLDAAQSIARMAEAKNDTQLAISYYKKAIPLISDQDPLKASTKKYFENKIIVLQGGQPNYE